MADISVVSNVKSVDSDWPYCGVKLTIHNIIIPEERLNPSPSQLDNMDSELETELRIVGCELIQDSGVLLRLPQVAMATAQVLYQRFFYSKSFVRHFYEHYAMACVFLAAKLEECPRRIRDVINVFHHIRQVREHKTPTPVMLDQSYSNLKNQVIKAERRILKELGFCVHAKHPHKLIICYLRILEQETNAELVQTSWNYMNDSLRTDLFVRYLPEAIACACIYLASCKLGIPLPRHPAWWEMFTVDEDSVHEISLCLVRLYARPKPCVATVEAELAKLRDQLVEFKKRELELKKVTNADASSCQGSVDISPNPMTEKLSLSSQDARKADDSETCETSGRIPTSSILANAIATAKAVAANISASKSALCSDVDQNKPTVSPLNAIGERNNAQPLESAKRRHSPDTPKHTRRNDEVTTSGRPAAYPNVFPEDHVSRKRHGKHRDGKRYSTRHSSSRSLTSASSSDEGRIGSNPTNACARHYRRNRLPCNSAHSTSESDTPTSSPSPIKRKRTIHRNKSRSRSCSTSSVTTSSSVDEARRSYSRKKHGRKTRSRMTPPAAYRIDRFQNPYAETKHRLSSKLPSLENGGSRHSDTHHHRHKTSEMSGRRNTVSSREHKRR